MENLAKDTGWKLYSREVALETLQLDVENQILELIWNAIMATQKKKRINWALQQTKLTKLQDLFLRPHSKQLHIKKKPSRELRFYVLKDKRQLFFTFKDSISN